MNARFLLPLLLPTFLIGCASVNPGPAFDHVKSDVSARTGGIAPAWNRGTEEDKQVEVAVRTLFSKPLTPDSALRIALLNNRSLQASFGELGLAQADLVQAGLLKNPSFGAAFGFPINSGEAVTNETFSLVGDFLDLLVLPLRQKLATQALEEAELRAGHETFALAADVRAAYFTLQADEELLARLRLSQEIDEAGAGLAEKQYAAGNLSDLDIANRRAARSTAQAALIEAQITSTRDREALNRLLGWDESLPVWTLASTILPRIPGAESDAPALETRAWEQRLDIAAARKRVEMLRSALGLAQGTALFPGGLRVGVTQDRSTDGIRAIGPTIDIDLPIFDQGQARTASLRAQLRQAEDRLAALSVEVRSQIREALAAAAGRRALAAYDREKLLPEKARIVKLTLERYNYMLTGPHDLLAAKEDLVAAERSYIETCRDYWIAHATLEKAVGSLLPIPGEADTTLTP